MGAVYQILLGYEMVSHALCSFLTAALCDIITESIEEWKL